MEPLYTILAQDLRGYGHILVRRRITCPAAFPLQILPFCGDFRQTGHIFAAPFLQNTTAYG
ncbi:hypothetical protein [Megasphaera cerevisiae]|uniref:hypothetical protein n=1 Tax=Megasphaera cerevisiae TaxID=39029 RepID=UPI00117CEEB2|nr:hypothetical protein [Megasphaera cerevisiae]